MKTIINSFLVFIILSTLLSSCAKDELEEYTNIVQDLKYNSLDNKVIPHRIDNFVRLEMIQQMGFTGWEIDLNFYIDSQGNYFKVEHDRNTFGAPSLQEYLDKVDLKTTTKLWLDTRGINSTNFSAIFQQFELLDSIYGLKDIVILESGFTGSQFKILRDAGWHTSYYLPYYLIDEWIKENDTVALENYAKEVSQQLINQNVFAISFDVSNYSFVKQYLEHQIDNTIVYHCWDLSLSLNDLAFIDNYFKKSYSKDTRIRTVLIPID